VSDRALPGRQGTIVWAISPFDLAQPFGVVQHDGSEHHYPTGRDLAKAVMAKAEPPEFDVRVPAKVRPVLLLQDRPTERFKDYAALQMSRVEKFAADAQTRIRDGRERSLFYLGHDKAKYGLDKEFAVDLTSLHRVHGSAIVSAPLGRIDIGELRTVCERLVEVCDLDLANLIVRKASELLARLREQ
jgi:hypothetical protein